MLSSFKALPRSLQREATPRNLIVLLLLVLLTVAHLWMTSIQRIFVADGLFDDGLFLDLGEYLTTLQWLGPYNERTLVKGPGYPLWIALVFRLHIPLLLAQQMLYASACCALLVALRPLIRSAAILVLVYAIMVMNPSTMSLHPMWLMLREDIYSSQCILLAACLLGVVTRKTASRGVQWAWAIAAGLTLGAVLITREESPWLAPLLAAMLIPLLWVLWVRRRQLPRFAWLIIPARPLIFAAVIVYTVSAINYYYYGIFTVVEITEPNFAAAIGATQRVEHEHWQRMVLVPKETRLRLYAVSPAFAKLEWFLEGPLGAYYTNGTSYIPELRDRHEYGGWWVWAVRHAAASIGAHQDGRTAKRFYRQVAREINDAVEDGRLKGGPRGGVAPPWRPEYLPLVRNHVPEVLSALFYYRSTLLQPDPPIRSLASSERVEHFRQLTRSPVLSNTPEGGALFAAKMRADPRVKALLGVYTIYHYATWPLAFAGLVSFLLVTFLRPLRRAHGWLIAFTIGTLVSVALRSAVLIFIHITSYPALDERYYGPNKTFALMACTVSAAVGLSAVIQFFQAKRAARPTVENSPGPSPNP